MGNKTGAYLTKWTMTSKKKQELQIIHTLLSCQLKPTDEIIDNTNNCLSKLCYLQDKWVILWYVLSTLENNNIRVFLLLVNVQEKMLSQRSPT